MKNQRKENLPERVVKQLGLDQMTEVFWSEDREKYISADHKPMLSLAFAGVDLVTVSYSTEVKKADHYLSRDDPYYNEQGEVNGIRYNKRPNHATHYCLGSMKHLDYVDEERHRQGTIEDVFPIVYLYPNEFTPFKKE